jgi:hypothetical protein
MLSTWRSHSRGHGARGIRKLVLNFRKVTDVKEVREVSILRGLVRRSS